MAAETPACAIRAACRRYAEQGAAVCHGCAWVVTETPGNGAATETLRWIADPGSRPADGPALSRSKGLPEPAAGPP